jgi:hypothetical protein
VDVLWDAVDAGAPDLPARLAAALCGDACPSLQDDDYDGPDCLLHQDAMVHAAKLVERWPLLHATIYGPPTLPEAPPNDPFPAG